MINSFQDIQKYIKLSDSEKEWFLSSKENIKHLEFGLSGYISENLKYNSIRLQFIPQKKELLDTGLDIDPLKEVINSPQSRIIHRYKNRIALLITDYCFAYCRHCFRRRWTASHVGVISDEELNSCALYIKNNPQITEILLTGGDPLTLDDNHLAKIIKILRSARADLIIRLCTRSFFSNPSRISKDFINLLKEFNKDAPLYLMLQFNHPDELGADVIERLELARRSGLFMFNQSVLLKGINDNVDVQSLLCRTLLRHGVKPYYLFLLDKVEGIEHFRVSIKDAMELERKMRGKLSGLEMPVVAIDLPQSGGKIPLCYNYIRQLGEGSGKSIFITPSGEFREY